jgi:lipopolysaccharide export system permease protein
MKSEQKTPYSPKFTLFSVMDRYIFTELLGPFLFGLGMFTSLGLSIGTLFDLVRKVTESGLLFSIAVQVLLLQLPGFLVLAFPMSMLLATLMAYSRLSSDSELIALRSIGINVYRLIIPSLILSLIMTGLAFVVNDIVVPASNYQAKLVLDRALNKETKDFREENIIYPEYKKVTDPDGRTRNVLIRLFYSEQFDGEQMKELTILDRSEEDVSQIVTADRAIWNIQQNTWDFFKGTIYIIAPDGSYRNIVRFDHQQLSLPRTPLDLTQRGRNYDQMSIAEAKERLEILRLSGDQRRVRRLEVRIQEKYALPFVCLTFGLVGSALGLRPQNTSKATSFGICVLIVFGYYLFAFISSSMGMWGVLSPVASAWLPNVVTLGVGTFLLTQSSS